MIKLVGQRLFLRYEGVLTHWLVGKDPFKSTCNERKTTSWIASETSASALSNSKMLH